MRSLFTATQPSSRYRIYKLSLVSMSERSQLVMKSSQKLSRLSMSDRQGLSLALFSSLLVMVVFDCYC
ncbi:hypothetical protein [Nostoc sp. 'Peltigera membranacea cyanobiont' 210A]|uniref:hypothetical protein n=1 Tax=Nostoc sp. 'Peltigera membranacea cyanobiont' 210A TaxID=2014529 RepID=UPI00167DEC8B|nr:hypothetical protein [Nostoc sp. 'Peltigera membranacea cyanobiont' 210A]